MHRSNDLRPWSLKCNGPNALRNRVHDCVPSSAPRPARNIHMSAANDAFPNTHHDPSLDMRTWFPPSLESTPCANPGENAVTCGGNDAGRCLYLHAEHRLDLNVEHCAADRLDTAPTLNQLTTPYADAQMTPGNNAINRFNITVAYTSAHIRWSICYTIVTTVYARGASRVPLLPVEAARCFVIRHTRDQVHPSHLSHIDRSIRPGPRSRIYVTT